MQPRLAQRALGFWAQATVMKVLVEFDAQPAWAQLYMQRQEPPTQETPVASYGAKAWQQGVDPSQN